MIQEWETQKRQIWIWRCSSYFFTWWKSYFPLISRTCTPIRSPRLRRPSTSTVSCSRSPWGPCPGMKASRVLPLLSLTVQTLRFPEFGFRGLIWNTFKMTPFACGFPDMALFLPLSGRFTGPWRIIWLSVRWKTGKVWKHLLHIHVRNIAAPLEVGVKGRARSLAHAHTTI